MPITEERHTNMKHEEINAWEKEEGMYHRGVIVNRRDVGLLTWTCGTWSSSPDYEHASCYALANHPRTVPRS